MVLWQKNQTLVILVDVLNIDKARSWMVIYGCNVNRFQIGHSHQVKNAFCFPVCFYEFAYFRSLLTMAFPKFCKNSFNIGILFLCWFIWWYGWNIIMQHNEQMERKLKILIYMNIFSFHFNTYKVQLILSVKEVMLWNCRCYLIFVRFFSCFKSKSEEINDWLTLFQTRYHYFNGKVNITEK